MTKGHLEKGWQKIYAKGPVTTLLYFQLSWITTKDDHDFLLINLWTARYLFKKKHHPACIISAEKDYFRYFLIFCSEKSNFSIQFLTFLQSVGNSHKQETKELFCRAQKNYDIQTL